MRTARLSYTKKTQISTMQLPPSSERKGPYTKLSPERIRQAASVEGSDSVDRP